MDERSKKEFDILVSKIQLFIPEDINSKNIKNFVIPYISRQIYDLGFRNGRKEGDIDFYYYGSSRRENHE